ncbi:MAG: GNAT family N-acetyltransferase [Bdellovibrionaceae bacterium]|nr:GNAT family N-acetyltransferase [Pseudobdellovibrionaceae bacterium]
MSVSIVYADPQYFESFRAALDSVARERVYIEMIEAIDLEKIAEFQTKLIASHLPSYFAVEDGKVVGWADISRYQNARMNHRGSLGMGLMTGYRGRGLGSRLLEAALDHAKRCGLEKVELSVYSDNVAALALYEKFGFTRVGLNRHFRKLDGRYFDCILMETFL